MAMDAGMDSDVLQNRANGQWQRCIPCRYCFSITCWNIYGMYLLVQ